jgi:hypothetical protein
LSGRGLCDGPIPRPEESYRLWCVSECDQVKINNLDTCCEYVEEVRTTKRNKAMFQMIHYISSQKHSKAYNTMRSKVARNISTAWTPGVIQSLVLKMCGVAVHKILTMQVFPKAAPGPLHSSSHRSTSGPSSWTSRLSLTDCRVMTLV